MSASSTIEVRERAFKRAATALRRSG